MSIDLEPYVARCSVKTELGWDTGIGLIGHDEPVEVTIRLYNKGVLVKTEYVTVPKNDDWSKNVLSDLKVRANVVKLSADKPFTYQIIWQYPFKKDGEIVFVQYVDVS